MRTDPFIYLSEAIEAVFGAFLVAAVILLAAAFVIVARAEIRDRWRSAGRQPTTTPAA